MIVAEYTNIFLTFNRPFLIAGFARPADDCTAALSYNPKTRLSEPVCTYAKDKQAAYHVLSYWNYFIEPLKM